MEINYGIDIVEVERIRDICARRKARLKKLFTAKEIKYCLSKNTPYPHFASRFAAKEAFLKAVSSGWQGRLNWTDMEVSKDEFGKPYINVLPGKKLAFMKKIKHVSLTISQDKNYAVAMVAIRG